MSMAWVYILMWVVGLLIELIQKECYLIVLTIWMPDQIVYPDFMTDFAAQAWNGVSGIPSQLAAQGHKTRSEAFQQMKNA